MITIPTAELIGCLTDVLPHVSDPKHGINPGVKIEWDGEALHFTVYDVYSGVSILWLPGEGAESEVDDSEDDSIVWGGGDSPWSTFLPYDTVKEIVKVFKLPSKLWRFPVNLKCSPTGDRLTIEREDGPRTGRFLQVFADPSVVSQFPDVRAIAYAEDGEYPAADAVVFSPYRLAAFGAGRPLGVLKLTLRGPDEPVGVMMGSRSAGFIYRSEASGVHRYSFLRDGRGVVQS